MEGKAATYVRNRHQANALLESGLVLAEMLMERQEDVSGEETEEDVAKDRWIEPAIRLKRGQRVEVSQRLYRDELGKLQFETANVLAGEGEEPDAEIFITIEPEPARWNLNKLARAGFGDQADLIWNRILTVAGVPEEEQSELVDSFYDWVDDDSVTVSADGAESDYYEAVGKVNLHDLTSIAQKNDDTLQNAFNTVPMAVLELSNDSIQLVRTNQTFRDFLRRFIFSPLYTASTPSGEAPPILESLFKAHAYECCNNGANRIFFDETLPDGSIAHCLIRHIRTNEVTGTRAIVVAVLSIISSE
jgi:hypothetical protein